MSEVGGHESLLWENGSWDFSNSDNSGGTGEKTGKNPKEREILVSPNNKKKSGGKGTTGGDGTGGGGGESDHEIHIWTERERRKKMRNMFSSLHALLPQLSPKADKSTIVDEAVSYIKTLQTTLQKLQKQKHERLQGVTTATTNHQPPSITAAQQPVATTREAFLADQGSSSNLTNNNNNSNSILSHFPTVFQTWTSPNVILNICGEDAHISVCSAKKPGLFAAICFVLEKHKLEVVTAHISSDQNRNMFMIQAHYVTGGAGQVADGFTVEEIYKQAAGEIMLWVNS